VGGSSGPGVAPLPEVSRSQVFSSCFQVRSAEFVRGSHFSECGCLSNLTTVGSLSGRQMHAAIACKHAPAEQPLVMDER